MSAPEPMEDPAKVAADLLREKTLRRRSISVEYEGGSFDVRSLTVGAFGVFFSNLVSQCVYARGGEERLFPSPDSVEAVGVEKIDLLRTLRLAALAHILTREDVEEIQKRLPPKE